MRRTQDNVVQRRHGLVIFIAIAATILTGLTMQPICIAQLDPAEQLMPNFETQLANQLGTANAKILKLDRITLDRQQFSKIASLALDELFLDRCEVADDAWPDLASMKGLRRLRLPGSKIQDDSLAIIGQLTQLENLDLNDCNAITCVGVAHLRTLTKLRSLTLSGQSADDASLKSLLFMTNLVALNLRASKANDSAFEVLKNFTKLKELDLVGSSVGSAAWKSISVPEQIAKLKLRGSGTSDQTILDHIANFTGLVVLDLGETTVGDDAMEAVAKASSLKDLNLLRSQVTDVGVAKLVELRLLRLNLDDTRITDQSTDVLARMHSLEFLHLGKTQVTDKCIASLRTLKNLKDLILNNTTVSSESIDALKQALPGLRVKQ
jgi:Leucine-rich repeat (LRR) protein